MLHLCGEPPFLFKNVRNHPGGCHVILDLGHQVFRKAGMELPFFLGFIQTYLTEYFPGPNVLGKRGPISGT